jgi:hypothetical protein
MGQQAFTDNAAGLRGTERSQIPQKFRKDSGESEYQRSAPGCHFDRAEKCFA